jgi:hypothetical protein
MILCLTLMNQPQQADCTGMSSSSIKKCTLTWRMHKHSQTDLHQSILYNTMAPRLKKYSLNLLAT